MSFKILIVSANYYENISNINFDEGSIAFWASPNWFGVDNDSNFTIYCEDIEDMHKVGGWKHEYLTKTKKKDAVMYIHDAETGEKYPITKKSIIDALQKMDNPKYQYTKALNRILIGQSDADDADIVVQTACFGEVVYG